MALLYLNIGMFYMNRGLSILADHTATQYDWLLAR